MRLRLSEYLGAADKEHASGQMRPHLGRAAPLLLPLKADYGISYVRFDCPFGFTDQSYTSNMAVAQSVPSYDSCGDSKREFYTMNSRETVCNRSNSTTPPQGMVN